MTTYPTYDEIPWSAPEEVEYQFKTLVSAFDDQGKEKRRRKWLYTKRMLTIPYNYITFDEANTLWQFYIDRNGSYDAFSFYTKDRDNYTKEYVGTGDNSTLIYSLPCKEANEDTVQVYFNQTYVDPAGYTFYSSLGPSGGVDGSDKIIFNTAPPDGIRVTVSFNGVLRVMARFKEDNLSFQKFYKQLTSVGVVLQGLLIDEDTS